MNELPPALIEAGASLVELIINNTVTAVKIKTEMIKTEKDIKAVRAKYDEIIASLIDERGKAIQVAQLYKNEVERLVISDEDINHLQRTVTDFVQLVYGNQSDEGPSPVAAIQILVNKNTLKALQLLGFNFKAAIGEPLTEACADAIRQNLSGKQRANVQTGKRRL